MKNTDNSYIINVKTEQLIDGERNTIVEKARGGYSVRGQKRYIHYKARGGDGEISSVIIIIAPDTVTIRRNGAISSDMRYKAGERSSSVYIMPYGKTILEIETDNIEVNLDDSGGNIVLDARLYIQNEEYINKTTIEVIGDIT